MQQPFGPGANYQINQTTGLRDVERYEIMVDETRTNTAVLTDSLYLVCPVQPQELIVWQATIILGYGASPGQGKVGFFTPAGLASGGIFGVNYPVGVPGAFAMAPGVAAYNVAFAALEDNTIAGALYPDYYWGCFVNGANSGQFSVRLAQQVANLAATFFVRGSYLEVWRR